MSRQYRHKPHKAPQSYSQLSSSDFDEVDLEFTGGPHEDQQTIIQNWMVDSTNISDIDEDESKEDKLAPQWPMLADKFLQGRAIISTRSVFLITTLGWFFLCGWLFIRDNELGRLDTIDGMKWFAFKVLVPTIVYIIVSLILLVSSHFTHKSPKSIAKHRPM